MISRLRLMLGFSRMKFECLSLFLALTKDKNVITGT